ncbi:hypothetical protein HN954_02230 [bacterium]|jgi:23S rRNA (cytosine1962-C5)-methyltransferase|nr:hypothetical protein [bacterium]MBT6831586.1 hypothetical protein [bacterium]MBT6996225.1 hypothetical protein [bacterium]MBT7772472.1 hypothetical protein [bacterium]
MQEKPEFEYALIDCGDERRVEKFGEIIVDRPCPQATWRRKIRGNSDAFFVRENPNSEWKKSKNIPETWNVKIGKIQAELRFSKNGQIGIFPEQWENWNWIEKKVTENADRPLKILNLFAYTGIATLHASAKNTEVCHVDGAKSAITWAKKNAEISGFSDAKIRWICDDVMKFLAREIRRGKKYDGIILDPPAFGRGAKKDWKIERDLPELMKMIAELLSQNPIFVVLTCHAPEHFSVKNLADFLENLPQFQEKKSEKLVLQIPSKNGNPLLSTFGARICF